jgi:hypothetical protein
VADGLQAVIEEAEEDKRILRTLHVVQALAHSDIVGIETCLASLKPVMVDLCSDDNDKIRNKAGQVLRGLEEQNSDVAAADSEVNSASRGGPQADLLTLDEVRDRVCLCQRCAHTLCNCLHRPFLFPRIEPSGGVDTRG